MAKKSTLTDAFGSAPVMPEKATAKKSKVAVKEQGKAFEVLCALRYIKKGIEGLEETYEGTAKDEVMDKFVAEGLEKHDRPANYRGKSGKGEASCQLQLRGSKSPLTADQVESITKLGLEVHEEEVSPEQFIFNSSVLSSPELRAKISAALSKIDCGLDDEGNPIPLILRQPRKTKFTATDETLKAVFATVTDPKEALKHVSSLTTLVLKTKWNGSKTEAWNVVSEGMTSSDEDPEE